MMSSFATLRFIRFVGFALVGFALVGFALVIQLKERESFFDIIRTYLFNREYLLCIYRVYKEYTNGFIKKGINGLYKAYLES